MEIKDETGTIHKIELYDKNGIEWFEDFSCEEGGQPNQDFDYNEDQNIYIGTLEAIQFWLKEISLYLCLDQLDDPEFEDPRPEESYNYKIIK